jgi:V-type H+-transporting ATPase subunit a
MSCNSFQLNGEVLSHQRKFTAEVRRIDEMERQLQKIRSELLKDEIEIKEVESEPRFPESREIIDLEACIEKCDTEIAELSDNFFLLMENQKGFIEFKSVLERAEVFLAQDIPLSTDEQSDENHQLQYVTGIIDVEKYAGFERMLWRVSHGNIFTKQAAIEEPFKDFKNVRKLSNQLFRQLIGFSSFHRAKKFTEQFSFPSSKALSCCQR